jgi:hypothetical protein
MYAKSSIDSNGVVACTEKNWSLNCMEVKFIITTEPTNDPRLEPMHEQVDAKWTVYLESELSSQPS